MKKILFLFVPAVLILSTVRAQVIQNSDRSKLKKTMEPVPVKTAPPPPPAANKTTSAPEALVYSLTSVRVKIRTGNDNKEFPSKVFVTVKAKSIAPGDWSPFGQLKLDNEMRINSETEFGLEREAQLRGEARLDVFQSSGVRLIIKYLPNFFADAWKIEGISLVMEFKDQYGNLHPTLGNKTIVFSNAYGFLNNEFQTIECVTDGSFAPMTALIKK